MARPRARLRWAPAGADAVIALGATAWLVLAVWAGTEPDERFADQPVSTLLLAPVGMALAFRRHFPLAVAGVVAVGQLLQAVVTGVFAQAPALALCIAVALYSLGAHATLRRALVGAGMIGATLQLKPAVAEPAAADDSPFVALFWWLLCLTCVGLGMLVRSRRRSAELQHEAARREEERAARERAVVVEERQRIARELHDVVSHNVSATILQATAAEELLRTDPERAGAALRSIQGMVEAIGEMRRMLGIMRDEVAADPTSPQPRLADLGDLVERVGEGGLDTRLETDGAIEDLAPGVQLSLYRIVQEALTNVTKHAAATRVVVSVRRGESHLEVRVDDDGAGGSATAGTGHGLVGMRERVELLGGELLTGPGREGGYSVWLRIPVDRAPA